MTKKLESMGLREASETESGYYIRLYDEQSGEVVSLWVTDD